MNARFTYNTLWFTALNFIDIENISLCKKIKLCQKINKY